MKLDEKLERVQNKVMEIFAEFDLDLSEIHAVLYVMNHEVEVNPRPFVAIIQRLKGYNH